MPDSELFDFLVVGDGPSALSFTSEITKTGRSIGIVSPGDAFQTGGEGKLSISTLNLPWKFSGNSHGRVFDKEFFSPSELFTFWGLGGLSNTWGAGCARLDAHDLGISAKTAKNIAQYYDVCAERIGISGGCGPTLGDYLGHFSNGSEKPGDADKPEAWVKFPKVGDVEAGRTRQAILRGRSIGNRKSCNDCSACFVNCERGSLFNAAHLFQDFSKKVTVFFKSKVISISYKNKKYYVHIVTKEGGENRKDVLVAKRIVLAAGVLETARLVSTLDGDNKKGKRDCIFPFKHAPMSRFFVLNPRGIRDPGAAGQTVCKVPLKKGKSSYVSLVHGASIPTSDIIQLLPVNWSWLYWVINKIKIYFVFGFIFLPSEFSQMQVHVRPSAAVLSGKESAGFFSSVRVVRRKLGRFFLKNQMILMPPIFAKMALGSDLHWGGILPMDGSPGGLSDKCELSGFSGAYVIDGSWMPRISEKPHTFTLMANAVRVANEIRAELQNK